MRPLLSLVVLANVAFVPLEALAKPAPKRVIVTNFPNPQSITGAVEVTNLPAVQDVNVVSTPPPGGASPRLQLVGFTSATFTGGQGVLGFTLACQQEFANSRMCASLEILETTTVPAGLAGEAWVRPTTPAGAQANGTVVDASGVSAPAERLTCDGWRVDVSPVFGSNGLVVDGAGRFRAAGPTINECGVPRAVACCAPVP